MEVTPVQHTACAPSVEHWSMQGSPHLCTAYRGEASHLWLLHQALQPIPHSPYLHFLQQLCRAQVHVQLPARPHGQLTNSDGSAAGDAYLAAAGRCTTALRWPSARSCTPAAQPPWKASLLSTCSRQALHTRYLLRMGSHRSVAWTALVTHAAVHGPPPLPEHLAPVPSILEAALGPLSRRVPAVQHACCTRACPSWRNASLGPAHKHQAQPPHPAASLVQALTKAPPAPAGPPCVQFEQFWVEAGPLGQPREASAGFVATPSVRSHLRNLARAVQLRKHPILLQVSGLHGHIRA